MQPLFSIIVPVYNVEKYITCCLESILLQEVRNYEIILINDGSKDNSSSICNNYSMKYPFIRLIEQDNKGLSSARNTGLQHARGRYIMFIDPDDSIKPGTLPDLSSIIKEYSPDIIVGQIEAFNELDANRTFDEKLIIPNYINQKPAGEALLHLIKSGISISPCVRYITSKELIEDNNLLFSNFLHEDQEWSPKLLINSNSLYLYPRKFYNYRLRSDSLSVNNNFQVYLDYCKIINNLYSISLIIIDVNKSEFLRRRCAYLIYKISNAFRAFNSHEKQIIIRFFYKHNHLNSLYEKYYSSQDFFALVNK
jgi:glycosyltransferase involved in cell wall biosynthesis